MLEALGLDKVAESVYLTLLEVAETDVGGIARNLGLAEDRVGQALDELDHLSLLQAPSSCRKVPRPVHPEFAAAALAARQQAQLARQLQEIEESKVALAALSSRHAEAGQPTAAPEIERLEGDEVIHARMLDLAASCEREACSFVVGGWRSEAALRTVRALGAEVIKRGGTLRIVCLDSIRHDRQALDFGSWLADLGSELRTVPALPMRMLVVDRRCAVATEHCEDGVPLAVSVRNATVLAALLTLFTSTWKAAVPLATVGCRDRHGLSAQERQMLELLATGLTDEAVARRLGVSVRTTRRRAADLMARLGAQSRFQAGVRAAVWGWVDADAADWPEV